MTNKKTYEEASEVCVEDGAVKIIGPDSIDVRLTPEAALETSDRLFGQAMKARGGVKRKKQD